MAWDKSKPADDGLLVNAPAEIRANLTAIELGTDTDLQITNAKCSSSMALPDSKLAQITTANKVSGPALTNLANIPSGAGSIPVANLGNAVAISGNENVAGIKTFDSFPILPSTDPTTDYQMATKKYVDDVAVAIEDIGSTDIDQESSIQIDSDNLCAYFNGSIAYLTIPASSDLNLIADSSNDFTIDFYVKHSDHVGTEIYIGQWEDADNRWQLVHVHGTGISFSATSGGNTIIQSTSGGEIEDTDFHHIALCKKGSKFGIYKDYVQICYVDDSSTDTFTGTINVGRDGDGTDYFQGNIEELRIAKNNLFDASPNVGLTDTITYIASSIGSSWRGVFDGSSSNISIPDHSDWNFIGDNSSDYTIDWKAQLTKLGTNDVMWTQTDGTNNLQLQIHQANNGVQYQCNIGGNILICSTADNGFISDLLEHHYALVINGTGTTKDVGLYIDGVQRGYTQDDSIGTIAGDFYIGGTGTYIANMKLDEFRVQNSNAFSATPNVGLTDTITVPTAKHAADANTHLLLHLDNDVVDSGNTGHTVTNNGITFERTTLDYSARFNSVGKSYLATPAHATAFNCCNSLSDNWTIECRVKLDDPVNDTYNFMLTCDDNIGNHAWYLEHIKGAYGWRFWCVDDHVRVGLAEGSVSAVAGQEYHIAACKVADEWGLYVDGVQIAYYKQTITANLSGYPCQLGRHQDYYSDCSVDEVRIIKRNVYNATPNAGMTDTITPVTTELVSDAYTYLLMHMDNNALDSGYIGHTFTNNNNVTFDTNDGDIKLLMHFNNNVDDNSPSNQVVTNNNVTFASTVTALTKDVIYKAKYDGKAYVRGSRVNNTYCDASVYIGDTAASIALIAHGRVYTTIGSTFAYTVGCTIKKGEFWKPYAVGACSPYFVPFK